MSLKDCSYKEEKKKQNQLYNELKRKRNTETETNAFSSFVEQKGAWIECVRSQNSCFRRICNERSETCGIQSGTVWISELLTMCVYAHSRQPHYATCANFSIIFIHEISNFITELEYSTESTHICTHWAIFLIWSSISKYWLDMGRPPHQNSIEFYLIYQIFRQNLT